MVPAPVRRPGGGWYDTDLVVHVDDDGLVTIRGRATSVAGIAGALGSRPLPVLGTGPSGHLAARRMAVEIARAS